MTTLLEFLHLCPREAFAWALAGVLLGLLNARTAERRHREEDLR